MILLFRNNLILKCSYYGKCLPNKERSRLYYRVAIL
nr:MAG TPA: hypothetical protein [Caudoviricetes sp.]